MKKAFVFYRSFYEAILPLNDDEKIELFTAICEYGLNQTETKLKPICQAMLTLIKPQLDANNARYNNGKKGGRPPTKENLAKPRNNLEITKQKPKEKEKEKEKEKDKDKDKDKDKEQNFTLSRKISIDKTSKEYQTSLEEYIKNSGKPMTYQSFYDYCIFKDYKYKNFKLAYDNWNREQVTIKEEIKKNYEGDEISTLYIGGGTPSSLSIEKLRLLFEILKVFKF